MSCNFIMPSSAMPSNPSAHPHYQPYRSPSQMPPLLSRLQQQQLQQQPAPVQPNVATPANSSPTSPRSNSSPKLATAIVQSRQLRPHKVPLYVPAVLRPTERPTRIGAGPPTPPYSASNSFDSSEGAQVAGTDGSLTPNHDLTSSHSSGNSSTSPHASNRNHNRLGQQPRLDEIDFVRRVVTDEWNDDALDDPDAVTGTPTRDHWKPDSSAPECDAPPCHRPFTLLTRRHHCRRCGNVFCAQHAPHQVPLDQHARFHPAGHLARACDFCWADYRAWGAARRRRCQMRARLDSGDSSATDSSGGSTPVTFNKTKNAQPTVVAASVPRDWHWSTF